MPTIIAAVLDNRLGQIARDLEIEADQACSDTAQAIRSRVSSGMSGPHTGRIYGRHQASAPGEMPAVDTTNLMNSILVEQVSQMKWVVYTVVKYAPHLEFGAPRAHIEPRPFFRPSAEEERPLFQNRLARLIRGNSNG